MQPVRVARIGSWRHAPGCARATAVIDRRARRPLSNVGQAGTRQLELSYASLTDAVASPAMARRVAAARTKVIMRLAMAASMPGPSAWTTKLKSALPSWGPEDEVQPGCAASRMHRAPQCCLKYVFQSPPIVAVSVKQHAGQPKRIISSRQLVTCLLSDALRHTALLCINLCSGMKQGP